MSKVFAVLVFALLTVLLAGGLAWSQEEGADRQADPAPPAESAGNDDGSDDGEARADREPEPEESEADESGPAVDLDELPELDEQTHQQDGRVFRPTEEIPVDQAIPFPTDI